MISAKEKAKELIEKFDLRDSANNCLNLSVAKKGALIAVDLAIEYNDFHIEFLQEVKQEIQKL
jgi:ethanolamine utilization microcompartment shell protein EutS